jgi:hypothetical protein
MTNTTTREEMIKELTRFEIEYLLGCYDTKSELIEFFAKGGFNTYNDKDLQRQYEIIFND